MLWFLYGIITMHATNKASTDAKRESYMKLFLDQRKNYFLCLLPWLSLWSPSKPCTIVGSPQVIQCVDHRFIDFIPLQTLSNTIIRSNAIRCTIRPPRIIIDCGQTIVAPSFSPIWDYVISAGSPPNYAKEKTVCCTFFSHLVHCGSVYFCTISGRRKLPPIDFGCMKACMYVYTYV